jgi:hypothetical protein
LPVILDLRRFAAYAGGIAEIGDGSTISEHLKRLSEHDLEQVLPCEMTIS